jgi:DNA-binding transcriptional MerR regulator
MSLRSEADFLRGLMRVGEAADYCGVTKETLRNWDRAGKLVARRHPITGYRYYDEDELKDFVARVTQERDRD